MKHGLLKLGRTLTLVSVAGLAGCRAKNDWMPLKPGSTWTYKINATFDEREESMRVLRPMTVAGAEGVEISSPFGVSRLAWRDRILWADRTANIQFDPPLPLLEPFANITLDKKQKEDPAYKDGLEVDHWEGKITMLGKQRDASAKLFEIEDQLPLGKKKVSTLRATLKIDVQGHDVLLKSWYQQGVGLVQQQQFTGAKRIVQLVLSSHSD